MVADSTVYYWGQILYESSFGNLGNLMGDATYGTMKNPPIPQPIKESFEGEISKIACGPEYMALLTTNGVLWVYDRSWEFTFPGGGKIMIVN